MLTRGTGASASWLVVGAIWLVAIGLMATGRTCSSMIDAATIQDRATVPAERLTTGQVTSQTFVPAQAGLTTVDATIARFDGQPVADLLLSLHDQATGAVVGARTVPADSANGARVSLVSEPQAESAGRAYRLDVTTTSNVPNGLTLWATDEPVYPNGIRTTNGQAVPGALSFRLYYRYGVGSFVGDLTSPERGRFLLVLATLVAVILPGLLLVRLAPPSSHLDIAEAVGLAIGGGIAFWAMAFWLATLGGTSLDTRLAVVALLACGVAIIAHTWIAGRSTDDPPSRSHPATASWPDRGGAVPVLVLLVTIWTLGLRLLVVRDLDWPIWVDSVHHTFIAQEIAAAGWVPETYGAQIPEQPFTYHFGFHALVAVVHWLTSVDLALSVLIVGQVLGGLIVLPVYLLARRMFHSPVGGLAAGVIVGCLSTMPAYYVSWGRYPQLAGLVVLPATLVAASWVTGGRLFGSTDSLPDRHEPGSRSDVQTMDVLGVDVRGVLLATVLGAGLVIVHPRVAMLLAGFGLALIGVRLVTAAAWRGARSGEGAIRSLGRDLAGLAVVAGLSAVILSPWLGRLVRAPKAIHFGDEPVAAATAFALPVYGDYDAALLGLAVLGALIGLWRRPAMIASVLIWIGIMWVLVHPYALGFPVYLFLSAQSVEIALFLPISLAGGALVGWIAEILGPRISVPVARAVVASALATVALLSGSLLDSVNADTILHTPEDVAAATWVRQNLPPDSRILINAYRWSEDIYAGSDGGYWLAAATSRQTTTPPLIYHDASPAARAPIHSVSERISRWAGDRESLDAIVRDANATHVYVGARYGALRPSRLIAIGYPVVYQNGRAWLFAVPGSLTVAASGSGR